MVVLMGRNHHTLNRWARGEEDAAQRGAIDLGFHGIDMTSWLRVLAAAMAGADMAPNAGVPRLERNG
jgi:hypothetical protein